MGVPLRVLLVEDSEEDALLVLRELRGAGFDPQHERVESPEAMNAALERGAWDLVLGDYNMPHFSGTAALSLLQKRGTDAPFIFVSGTIGEDIAVAAMKGGAQDYVMKGNLKRLVPAIQRELREAEVRRERRRAQEALLEPYRSLVEDASFGIFSTTPDGRLLAVNPAMVEMLGYDSATELLQRSMTEISAAPEARAAFIKEVIDTGRLSVETAWRSKDGRTLAVRETARVVRDGEGKPEHFTIVVENVSERRLLEKQLRQAQKMEAIGRLAGGVAHDFNNLLTAILGFADLQLEKLPADHPAREDGEEIRRAALRAAELTRQLLAFSRQQNLAPRVLSVNDVVTGMEKMLRRLIGEDIHFHTSLPDALGRVRIDPGRLEQVIVNLAVNARDAMPGGGRLTIETADVDLDEALAREYGLLLPGAYVLLAVTDSGTGMDAETRARLFEPFFTTKPKGQGTGLGLATVYGIVQQSGGHIWAYSEPGRGTTFKIYLPRIIERGPAS